MYMIVGASGFLGSYLVDELLKSAQEKIIAVYHNRKGSQQDKRITWVKCDITCDCDMDALNRQFPDKDKKVVFLTACHNPDVVYGNPRFAWHINVVSLANFINKLDNVAGLIYTSTDAVYGNSIDGYKYIESSTLHPVNIYGRQKALAEQVVVSYGYHVVRLPFMIGHSLAAGKGHFYDDIISALRSGKEIEMFVDSYRSTLSFRQAARYILRAFDFIQAAPGFPHIINLCADQGISKYDVGIMVAKRLGAREELIKPACLAENKTIFKSPRADTTIMDNTLMKKWYGLKTVTFDVNSC